MRLTGQGELVDVGEIKGAAREAAESRLGA